MIRVDRGAANDIRQRQAFQKLRVELEEDASSSTTTSGAGWTKYTVKFSDFLVAGSSRDIELFALQPKQIIHGFVIWPTQSFGGGTLTTYTLSVGITGNLTKYASAFSVTTPVTGTNLQLSSSMGIEHMTQETSVRVAAVGDAPLNNAQTGEADIWALTSILP